ncbi:RNA polymerase II transcription factor B subunit 4 [Tanacetum coccineum]|uniref:General transcription and DNA repair factor IIH subunit TFB4 n=1 Tax=Tanacetum coccineum TaxID=301880 RepID=A0ABQ4X906_9ASTR
MQCLSPMLELVGDKELMELGVDKKNVDRQLRGEHCKVLNLINEKGFAYSKYRSHKIEGSEWCMDFEKQGFCLRGDMCPIEHGLNRIVVENVSVPIDSCVIGSQHSTFLQQASYITGGVYLRPQHLDGLFQYLTTIFVTDLHSRNFLQLSKHSGVDFCASSGGG